jgi:tyrosyl-DNA phosphodiesterase 2
VAALMHYLQRTFGNDPGQLVVLLQEVSQLSALQILQIQWVRQNFIVIGHEAPRTFQAGIPRQARYYTMAMTPRSLRLQKCFRMPLLSEMGRNALFVDLDLRSSKGRPSSVTKEVLRICTTHLESLQEGNSLRAKQLELISQNLKGVENELGVIAGIVGGDMNAIHNSDRTLHRQLGLKDPWEDQLANYGKEDSSNSQLSGHTWGYQSKSTKFAPACLDKFLYCGCVKTTTLTNTQGVEETIGRLGVGLTADVSLEEHPKRQQTTGREENLQKVWVSDHYGIVMGVKILA